LDNNQLQTLIRDLQFGSAQQRRAASYKLGKSNDPAVVPLLIHAYDDQDGSVRQNVIDGLRKIGSEEALHFLDAHKIQRVQEEIQSNTNSVIQLLILIIFCFLCFFIYILSFAYDKLGNIEITLTILGTWLSAISVIGKKRLKSWEIHLNLRFKNADEVPDNVQNNMYALITKLQQNKYVHIYFVSSLFLLALAILPEEFTVKFIPERMHNTLLSISILLFLPIFIFLGPLPLFFSNVLVVLIKLLSLPYTITSFFDNDDILERTILLIGAIILTLGIFLGK